MTEKIDWYKEVLEIEPNSKVFLPLAKLLVQDNLAGEAIATLEKGLERHPDFLEARLLLIELLHRTGNAQACNRQITKLSQIFASYAGFWEAWAACLSANPADADTAAIVRVLAATFIAGPLQLHQVLDRGAQAIIQEKKAATQAACPLDKFSAQAGKPEMESGADGNILPESLSDSQEEAPADSARPVEAETLAADVEPALDSGLEAQPEQETTSEIALEAAPDQAETSAFAQPMEEDAANGTNDFEPLKQFDAILSESQADGEANENPPVPEAGALPEEISSTAPEIESSELGDALPELETDIASPVKDLPAVEIAALGGGDLPMAEAGATEEILQDSAAEELELAAESAASLAKNEEISGEEPEISTTSLKRYNEEEAEEPFSLRTRSMADVLAEQGDLEGALDIYAELSAAEPDPDKRRELEERMAHLKEREAHAPADKGRADSETLTPATENILGILEALARRVEARAAN